MAVKHYCIDITLFAISVYYQIKVFSLKEFALSSIALSDVSQNRSSYNDLLNSLLHFNPKERVKDTQINTFYSKLDARSL